MEKILNLFNGRHDMPKHVKGAVFGTINNPNDLNYLMVQCHKSLYDCDKLTLYVTGLSTALCTVINYCEYNNIDLTLMHHDKRTNTYVKQKIYNPTMDSENNTSINNEKIERN